MMFFNSIICFFILFKVYFTLSFELWGSKNNKITFKPNKFIFKDSNFCSKKDAYFYDYPDGDLSEISSLIEKSHYNFIFLYANWDARSSYHSNLFLKLACEFYNEITFLSVNCFYGQCKTHFNLIKYPQILISIKNIGSFAYKNLLEYDYMTQYLKSILRPIRRIDNYEEFFSFISYQNIVVIGNFDFSKQGAIKSFENFYVSSLNHIGSNDQYFIGYGLILNKTLLTQIQKLVKSNDDEIMIFTKLGLQNTLRTISNIKPEKLTQLTKDILLSISSPAKWLYPDINSLSNRKNTIIIFLNKENSNQYMINISIINLFLIETFQSVENLIRNQVFLKRYFDYVEFHLTKLQCKNSNFFTPYLQDWNFFSEATCFSQDNTDFFLLDINLYKNYAQYLLGYLIKFPNAIFVDIQNKTIYTIRNNLNLNNIIKNKFKYDPKIILNNKLIKKRTKDFSNEKNRQLNKIFEINSNQLNNVINNDQFQNLDVLVVYFNNHCGFCRLVNFHLINLVNKYFKNCKSIVFLKIDADLNDLDWSLSPDRIPALLFLPTTLSTPRETFTYNIGKDIKERNLLNFIINNTKNLDTILHLLSFMEKSKIERRVSSKVKIMEKFLKKNKESFDNVNQCFTFEFIEENINSMLRTKFFEQIKFLKNII